ncbi:uncharacterized protein MONOS_1320 [Monocercomonoides exilis]|uniref:uncharacterized protein n=1 Tax=Monocercomonoides exilis TaxID=2049356 RepID=UPI00355A7B75|nr:hypothetical protein MONOS_1320 [Monocercomonoides exilis]|eukprot:MONOS_1320.1-p1 / transcript=MONOS_1320.1 / gene=MONOS_1320 / organism=Monocercomonoides_exilis_PA203 / gene_product=unspecified product / transcript_product=unspecified product / location=Mono_scaffold00022:208756-210351(+) / protein_length=487 / sequence_SO=supercontig / SO=protein_coding / is_pseudo=false
MTLTLSEVENIKAEINGDSSLFGGVVQLYEEVQTKWQYSGVYGALFLTIKAQQSFLVIVELEKTPYRPNFVYECYSGLSLVKANEHFIQFYGDNCWFGFLFVNPGDASMFEKQFQIFLRDMKKGQLKTETKSSSQGGFLSRIFKRKGSQQLVIGLPTDFRHGMGFSSQSGSLSGSFNSDVLDVIRSQGLTDDDILGDPDLMKFLMNLTSKYHDNETPPLEEISKLAGIVMLIVMKKKRGAVTLQPAKEQTSCNSSNSQPSPSSLFSQNQSQTFDSSGATVKGLSTEAQESLASKPSFEASSLTSLDTSSSSSQQHTLASAQKSSVSNPPAHPPPLKPSLPPPPVPNRPPPIAPVSHDASQQSLNPQIPSSKPSLPPQNPVAPATLSAASSQVESSSLSSTESSSSVASGTPQCFSASSPSSNISPAVDTAQSSHATSTDSTPASSVQTPTIQRQSLKSCIALSLHDVLEKRRKMMESEDDDESLDGS